MDIRAALADLIGMERPLEDLAGGNEPQRDAGAAHSGPEYTYIHDRL
jgi:hypothetical protein